MSQVFQDPFVTVVSVGIEDKTQQCTPKKAVNNSEYITVLTIGNEVTKTIKDVTEEVIVYRLPGERLGFGLKFEGGTKAHEFVKRLFIQSCADDSPASRVQSSWGQLVEGDEVLEIDSIPVNSMTRIDCVRFLKDSNVAIKLLVKHSFNTPYSKQKSKSSEDLPVIISTEEKKPPPVPPRKVHRKLHKNVQSCSENIQDNIVPTIKQLELFSSKSTRLQSPRNSFRKKYSPDVSRRLSDGSLGPPDAEVYLDLISQESTQSLSESDDTGSTISTVLDRFASFPNTTTSSFSGSLPSTPTSIQKQLDLSYIVNDFPDDDFIPITDKKFNKVEENNNIVDGTEQKHCSDHTEGFHTDNESSGVYSETSKRPIVIPRSRDKINKHSSNDSTSTLPRLVDFVPKSPQKEISASYDTLKRFLDSERFDFEFSEQESDENGDLDYNMDTYSSKWQLSSHLSTIGEDEEEQSSIQENSNNVGIPYFTPRVVVDTTDLGKPESTSPLAISKNLFSENECDKKSPMEIPPSDSRQPPDGHEFPDFIETTSKATVFTDRCSLNSQECATNFNSTKSQPVIKPLDRLISSSNYDLRPKMTDPDEEKYEHVQKSNLLHNRSQSLIDVSVFSEERSSSKWNTLMEQRKSRLSKLKGLVIPETAENDITPLVNIPEIKSITTSQVDLTLKQESRSHFSKAVPPAPITPVVLPSWSSNATLPKYSPAFKRKSLQVYPTHSPKKSDSSDAESSYDEYINKYSGNTPSSRTTDDPKSLESIASPTRSDCSFDYTIVKTISIKDGQFHNTKDFADSDNDSAMSSSQSSYNSRSSPPPSPSSEEKLNAQNRMLKPSSLEAINRKNILASAKCRSGKDIKIGSPVIQRKGSMDEMTERSHLQEIFNTQEVNEIMPEEHHATNISVKKIDNAENVHEHTENNTVLVNQHVEVNVQQAAEAMLKVPEIPEEKPVPTKRTLAPAAAKDTKPQQVSSKTKLESLLQKHSASIILEKRNKPVDIRSLKANFENSSAPVFPKSYKANGKTLPVRSPLELGNSKPVVTTRRRSEELNLYTRRKSDDKLLFNQVSHEKKPTVDTRRLSSGSLIDNDSFTKIKEEPIKIKRTSLKKERYSTNNSVDHKISSSSPSAELRTVELNLDQSGGSLGITLAGGVDYENKIVTIHRIRYGSIAYHDGQLKKGDKVISINGVQTKGLTHSAATELLKAPVTKFSIIIEESRENMPLSSLSRRISSSVSSLTSETKGHETDNLSAVSIEKKPTHTIHVAKDGAGLGFSIEGGKDSPKGDVPLVVKKIFAGGAADKSGELKVGDEILKINQINFQNLSRIEAWSLMKKIPEGDVTIEIFR